jgi:uncharacterized protein YukE
MATYTVDLSGIGNAAAQLENVAARIEQAMYDLQARINTFMQENIGQAINNYHEVQTKWNTGLHQVREGTVKATTVLRQIGENYEEGDLRGAAIFIRVIVFDREGGDRRMGKHISSRTSSRRCARLKEIHEQIPASALG